MFQYVVKYCDSLGHSVDSGDIVKTEDCNIKFS